MPLKLLITAAWLTVISVNGADLIRIAHYGFEGNLNDSTGTQAPFEPLWDAGISNGVLHLGPAYQPVAETPRLNGFSYRSFTVAVDFKLREFQPFGNLILSGGPSYRWFTLETWGDVLGARFATKNGEFLMGSENVRVTTNQWYQVVVSADLDTGLAQIHLNGVLVLERNIGRNAEFNVVGTDSEPWDKVFSFRNYGNAATLVGSADNLQVFNRAATASEVASIIAPRLNIGVSGGVVVVSASVYLTDYRLEFANGLGATPVWQSADVIPLRVSDQFVWPVVPSVSAPRHGMFRLVKR